MICLSPLYLFNNPGHPGFVRTYFLFLPEFRQTARAILTTSQKVHLRRCASSFVTATYNQYVSFPKNAPQKRLENSMRALHLELFAVSSVCGLFMSPSISGLEKKAAGFSARGS